MGYLIVRFPETREVRVDGVPHGRMNIVMQFEAGLHDVTLGPPRNFAPSRRRCCCNTAAPMESLSADPIDYAINRQSEREQAQTNVRRCNQRRAGCGAEPFPTFAEVIRTCFVEISFAGLLSPAREELLALPTTFALPEATVKRLIDVAGTLLDASPSFQKLLRALRGEASPGAGVGEHGNCS
jgi:hypothetical protein